MNLTLTLALLAMLPPGAEPLTGMIPDDSFLLLQHEGYQGSGARKENLTEFKPHRAHNLKGYLKDDMSSLKWNLPDGVLVVLYQHSGSRGQQLPIWGAGQLPSVKPWDFDDKVSRWSWFFLGNVANPPRHMLKGRSLRPTGARPTKAPLPDDAIFLWTNGGFRGRRAPLADVTGYPQRDFHLLVDDMEQSVASLQWSLPPGVIVILYGKPDGTGKQFVIWGKGEQRSTRRWGGGGVSSWAWFSLNMSDEEP